MSGATHFHRIYATQELLKREISSEKVMAPFTDHLAAYLHISIHIPIIRMGRVLWNMYCTIVAEPSCTDKLRRLWEQLQRKKGAFPNPSMLRDCQCKRKIRQLFHREQAERPRNHCLMGTTCMNVYMLYCNGLPIVNKSCCIKPAKS